MNKIVMFINNETKQLFMLKSTTFNNQSNAIEEFTSKLIEVMKQIKFSFRWRPLFHFLQT